MKRQRVWVHVGKRCPTCACCGFRNLNIKNATGSYQEVELKDEVELQRELKKKYM